MGFVAYFRVSTREQGDSGLGLDAQRAIIGHYIDDDELVAEFTEVASGKDAAARPKLTAAVRMCQEGGHHLAVAKVDRLSRKTEDALAIRNQLDARLFCGDLPMAPGDLCDKFMLTLFMAIADRERELISIRTKAALEAKRQREPDWQPGTPENLSSHGRRRGSKTMRRRALRELQSASYTARLLRDAGASLRDIAEELNRNGYRTRQDKEFRAMTVKRMLDRAAKDVPAPAH